MNTRRTDATWKAVYAWQQLAIKRQQQQIQQDAELQWVTYD